MRLCKDGLNQATSCSNGRAADDDSDDDWGTWAAPAPVEVEDEEEDYDDRWDEEEGADDDVEVVEVEEDEDEEDDEVKVEAAREAMSWTTLDDLCESLDDQFANRTDVCPIHMTHWVPKGDAAKAREQTGTGFKRRRGSSHRAG